jgi:oxygen-independent coproporphyrinogen-3 oxidase
MTISQPLSIYLHIPFCVQRCGYCDFTTYAGKDSFIPAYVEALCNEIKTVTESIDEKMIVHTIFFGGGTPSLLSLGQFDSIFKILHACFSVNQDAEISLEANPGTINLEYLKGLRELGFNRLSLGAQSTNKDELQLLGRIHTCEDIFNSVQAARVAGFNNLNLDLIFGLPGQILDKWKKSLAEVVILNPEHVSLYALSIEKGTSFGDLAERGLMEFPDPDMAADMYEWACEELDKAGYQQYEISNWAKINYQCNHNLQYWRNRSYLGFGAGAHGYVNCLRVSNVLRIKEYINRNEKTSIVENARPIRKFPISPATVSKATISKRTSMQETLMLGLRLTREGVSDQAFYDRFEEGLMVIFKKDIIELQNLNLVEWCGDSLRLTKRGRLLGNQVFMRFVD